MTLETLRAEVSAGAIDTVVVGFTDMQGRLVGKRVSASHFCEQVARPGIHFCNYLLGTEMEMACPPGFDAVGWDQGYGDWLAIPDLSTLHRTPWAEGTAAVLCDVADDARSPVSLAPRQILRRQLGAAAELGFTAQMASELEFYLFRETYESAHAKHFHDLQTFGWYNEDYQLLQGAKAEPLYRALRNALAEAGVPVEFSKGEAGPGQHEVNLRYAPALEAADRHVVFKQAAKEIAIARGLAVTFMAKFDHRLTGSSSHVHCSLWHANAERSAFADASSTGGAVALAGATATMRHFLAGLCAWLPDFALFLAPTINSYKRYAVASWAPVNFAWGMDNRTTGLRVVGHGPALRVETRMGGADCNPYLVYAAILAAGLEGIRRGEEPPHPCRGNAYTAEGYPRMPPGLPEAAHRLRNSAVADAALGRDVVQHYAHAADVEQAEADRVVTCWERERYFERI